MLRKWRHNKIAFYPITVFPSRVLTEPNLVIYPVCLKHIGGKRHIEVCEITTLIECRFSVLGILNCYIESLEDNEGVALAPRVRVVKRIENETHSHCRPPLTYTLLRHEVAHIDKVYEDRREGNLLLQVLATDKTSELAVVDSDGLKERW